MAVYVNNIVIDSGTEFYQEMTILDSTGDNPINLTGYAATSMMRKHSQSSTKTADFVVDSACFLIIEVAAYPVRFIASSPLLDSMFNSW